MAIQIKRGTKSALSSNNPTLLAGQPCFETDTGNMKIGDGSKTWSNLPYVGSGLYLPISGGTISGNITATKFIGSLQGNADTATKLGTSTVGGTAKPIYLNNGAATALSSTVGSATQPVYMDAGTIKACTYTLGKSVPSDAVFTDTNTEVTNTLNNTAKAYITGTTSSSTNTGTQVFDNGVYLDTVAGRLHAGSLSVGNAILSYDTDDNALKISFS